MPEPAPRESAPGQYVVTGAGCCYAVDGDPANIGLALRGHVVALTDEEALRLIIVGAVAAASDADVERDRVMRERQAIAAVEQLAGPADNPYGGQAVGNKTLEQHAREQIELAHKAGTLPPDAKIAAKP